jgi:hypothetical protein
MNRLNLKQKLIVVVLDIIVLTELAACLYWTYQFQESMTPIFLKTYLPLVFVTLVIGKIIIHRARSKDVVLQSQETLPTENDRYYLFS